MPQFQLSFITANEDILGLLHEENDLHVAYGKTKQNLFNSVLTVTRLESNRVGENRRQVSVIGLFSALSYLGNSNLTVSTAQSALEVLQTTVKKYFNLDSNVTKSLDTQAWVQPNVTDRKFVNDLWLHTDLGKSFPAIGISSDGRFIVRDVLLALKADYKWRFTTQVEDKRDILYDNDPVFSFDTGMINNWVGYSRQKLVYDQEEGTTAFVQSQVDPTLSKNVQLSKKSGINKRFSGFGVLNDNMHPNYHSAYQFNVASLASFSSMKLTLSFTHQFQDVRVLDKVMFIENKIKDSNSAAEYHSGLYFVTKVSRSISNKKFNTLVQLCREAPNSLRTS